MIGYEKSTPVQEWLLPIIGNGMDAMVCAQANSGKTAAFVLPMIDFIHKARVSSSTSAFSHARTVDVQVMAPAREIVLQIYMEANWLSAETLCKIQIAYGGASQHQRCCIRQGCDILIGIPGRLKQFVKNRTIDPKYQVFCPVRSRLAVGRRVLV